MREVLLRYQEADGEIYGQTAEESKATLEKAKGQKPQGRAHAMFAAGKAMAGRGQLAESIEVLSQVVKDLEGSKKEAAQKMSEEARGLLTGARLRHGESLNCLANHNEDSCLLPLANGGLHQLKEPMEAVYASQLVNLETDPEDLVSRWQLNIAAMALGIWPDGVDQRWVIPAQAFASEEEFPRFHDVGPGLGLGVNDLAGNPLLDDFDGDGDLDLVASSMGMSDPLRYFENLGNGRFEERTESAGLSDSLGGLNCNHADYDNDGDLDIFVMRGAWMELNGRVPNSLLRNNGDGTFVDVTQAAGLMTFRPTQASAWADFDSDGWVDLFVGNEPGGEGADDVFPSEMWHNQGDGTFRDVIASSGVEVQAFTKGVHWGDYDNDGDPDLFVSRRDGASRLYRNDTAKGAAAEFVDVTEAAGLDVERKNFPCWFFDYDNDGNLDIFVGGFGSSWEGGLDSVLEVIPKVRLGIEVDESTYPQLWHNNGDGTFVNVAKEAGLQRVALIMGSNFGDLDNDGWPDLYLGTGHPSYRALMANRVFHNKGGERFLDVTTAAGMGHLQKGHGISFGDVDGDGDQDIVSVLGGWFPADTFPNALYENPGFGNHWITLRLEGRTSNRAAIGARIAITVETPGGTRTIHHQVNSGGSFGGSSLAAEIGLGDATAIKSCSVRWPGGETQELKGLQLDTTWKAIEGEAPVALKVTPFKLKPDAHSGH